MIGIVDSGIGGLMVLFSLMRRHPGKDFTLIYDNRFFPYGEKSIFILKERLNILKNKLQNCDKIILACNTLSSIKDEVDYPFIDVITPTIKAVRQYYRVGVIASKACIKSNVFQKLLMEDHIFKMIDGQQLINAIENNKNIKEEFDKIFLDDIDCLILGCTHFIYIKDWFKEKCPTVSQDEIIEI